MHRLCAACRERRICTYMNRLRLRFVRDRRTGRGAEARESGRRERVMMQSRRMLVLRAVVEDYIRSQEPVGSASLARGHELGVSSATIRNDMSALEDEGYLIQPHTSAGRIPTEKGYRYFVDRLAKVVPLSHAQRNAIDVFLAGSVSLQDTLQRAARLLAGITGQIAVVASPALSKSVLRHIEIVPVAANVLLAVIIADTGRVAQHTLRVDPPAFDDLTRLMTVVNDRCAGLPLRAAADAVRAVGMGPFTGLHALAECLAGVLDDMVDDDRAGEMYMAGASSLAHRRSDDLAPMLDALEEQVVIMRLMSALSEESGADGVGVAIGSETHTPGLLHASVVTGGYGGFTHGSAHPERGLSPDVGDGEATASQRRVSDGTEREPVAFVGSIGPTHMDYAATIAAVRAVARYLTDLLANENPDDAGVYA